MFDPSKFTVPTAKPLPVILLLDVSGSMRGQKIEALNKAVQDMVAAFADQTKREVEIQVAASTFGEQVSLHLPYTAAANVAWTPLAAGGQTPLATALEMAKAMVEDKKVTPSRAYRPAVVLVSDGAPFPREQPWRQALQAFVSDGRSSKCERMALGIGSQTDESVLEKFVEGSDNQKVFHAEDAAGIADFFKFVTMSVTTRSKADNPNMGVNAPVAAQGNSAPAASAPAAATAASAATPAAPAAASSQAKPKRNFYW